MDNQKNNFTINEGAKIGHVHLKVSNIDRSLEFYRDLLGFRITQRFGHKAVFLSANDYHHHIALNCWESENGTPPPFGTTGLYHTAILYPSRRALAEIAKRLLEREYPLDGAANHGVSEALYLRDPDQNGVELYCDTPKELWPYDKDGNLSMYTHPLDWDNLLATLN
jgi:catechol 2,3-dioxygenase